MATLPLISRGSDDRVQSAEANTFAQWRTLVSDSFVPLDVRSDASEFHGTLRSRVLDELSIVEVTANGHQVLRTPALIARTDRHYFKLNLQLSGQGILIQDNREATLRPGDLAVYDTHRPYTLAFEQDFRTLVLMFPHDALDLPVDAVGQLTARRMPGDAGLGRMISPFMVQLAENLDALSGSTGHRLAYNAVDLVATMFESELNIHREPTSGPRGDLLASIRSYIEGALGDPGLSPATIAAAHFISTRHLHNVFHAADTTVSSWIRARRLEHCRRDLRDPILADRSVGDIAARWGFIDAAHFSRIFRAAFGEPPSAYRRG
ncbi:helix-turn-helix domain-containing protein [Cryobacterium sp. TMT1-21]|uniref:Helix-turn-helix domain-containing protein n=1 Tax=Cryobacterium shii TaxID=1259235 RepID=A0AAQ2C4Q6_9MICO|nr:MULTISPECIES: helix-turn-helix domain-containing protein [Cryobacterium]TFC42841.1 helix-turn-helix domain-containing protein [Cryobacterium shii]TFC89044.1 helix-turn-helix domain-containing protein [Cryobacterium sp. TmT2-59]TFD11639.1 helix-turn-helix domain-containing protein [Cryobacterium sp. TMT4-10]TFD14775.1 helix-turn-helix domain-containing protein [Cryobacterium sp. TMT1-21]TFD22344.1 helix-turn-helix domain-containing protein [Cryobacterium sp. TMT2-23]